MLRAVFFDLDETLIDAAGCHHEASHRAFAKFGMDWDEALARTGPMFGRRMREILRLRRDALGVSEAAAPLEKLVALRESVYAGHFPNGVMLLPGAGEAMASVQAHGALAAIVSSSTHDTIERTLVHYGLSSLVKFVVGGDDVERGKPFPDCYEAAYRRVRSFAPVAKTDCLVVEDSSVGVTAAIAAGLPVCLVPLYPLAEDVRPAYTLTSLTEFPTLVARLAND